MAETTRLVVGGTAEDDASAFLNAWKQAESGAYVRAQRVIAFQSWEGLANVLTGERYRLLRWLKAHPEPSVTSLAHSLHREMDSVTADVRALEDAGLIKQTPGSVHVTADRLQADIPL
jgi:predicted transcriptional regulator